jgi:hypothetical protein
MQFNESSNKNIIRGDSVVSFDIFIQSFEYKILLHTLGNVNNGFGRRRINDDIELCFACCNNDRCNIKDKCSHLRERKFRLID